MAVTASMRKSIYADLLMLNIYCRNPTLNHIANVTSKKYASPRSAENSPEESEAFMKDLEENHT